MSGQAVAYTGEKYWNGMTIGRTIDKIRRYGVIEQGCVRALAGWYLRAPAWETKLQLGHLLYAHAERAYELQGRLEELRGGNRDVNVEPSLERFAEELPDAPEERSFIGGLAHVLQALAEAYRSHRNGANPAANAKEIRLMERFAADVERELAIVGELLASVPAYDVQAETDWLVYLDGLLRSAGGIDGGKPRQHVGVDLSAGYARSRFPWPTPIVLDERIRHADLGTYESKLQLPLRERSIGEFEVYFNELYAAAIVATIIYESWKISAPRQYFMDIAQQFWDEVRHVEFGAIRLRELGVEPSKANMSLYDQSSTMPLLHRYCYLTLGLEVFFMPRKSVRTKYYEEQGDSLSQLFADVDWSEEINHVRYGKRWIDHFLKDDHRTVEDLQAEVAAYLEQYAKLLPPGKKAAW